MNCILLSTLVGWYFDCKNMQGVFFYFKLYAVHFSSVYTISQQMHCSDSLLISYSFYLFRRMYVIIREQDTQKKAPWWWRTYVETCRSCRILINNQNSACVGLLYVYMKGVIKMKSMCVNLKYKVTVIVFKFSVCCVYRFWKRLALTFYTYELLIFRLVFPMYRNFNIGRSLSVPSWVYQKELLSLELTSTE
jgi:hypothetical protein